MRRLEDELKEALRREEAPPGLVNLVMFGIDARDKRKGGTPWFRAFFGRAPFVWASAGCALLLLTTLLVVRHEGTMRSQPQLTSQSASLPVRSEPAKGSPTAPSVEGEAAKRELLTALHIASVKLNIAQRAVAGVSVRNIVLMPN
jgi:hypothetical protein